MCQLDDVVTDVPSNRLKSHKIAARALQQGENRPGNPKSSGPVELIKLNSPFPLPSPSNCLCLKSKRMPGSGTCSLCRRQILGTPPKIGAACPRYLTADEGWPGPIPKKQAALSHHGDASAPACVRGLCRSLKLCLSSGKWLVSLWGHQGPQRTVRRHQVLRADQVERQQEGGVQVHEGKDLQTCANGGDKSNIKSVTFFCKAKFLLIYKPLKNLN